MWREALGVNVNLERQEWKVYLNSLSLLDYDIARSSWVGDYPDPNTFLDMFLTGGGNNRTGWSSAEYDRLIAEATHILGQHRRVRVIYVAIVDGLTMEMMRDVVPGKSMLAISAWIDEVRLIDNVVL
jgi:oligopeptide transport system substrate-binding protein